MPGDTLFVEPRLIDDDWATCPEAAVKQPWVHLLMEAYGHIQAGGQLSDIIPRPTRTAAELITVIHREVNAKQIRELKKDQPTPES